MTGFPSDCQALGSAGGNARPNRCLARRAGFTLIEALVATVLVGIMCAGLFAVGIRTRRVAEHSRVATEARSLAKQKLEEAMAVGLPALKQLSCTALNGDTNRSEMGYAIIRRPHAVWHGAGGVATQRTAAVFAEVHVDVAYLSPLFDCAVTDTYSVIVSE